jgi:hypothetical protein
MDRGGVDALDHRLGDRALLAVEAKDESGGHKHAGAVDLMNAVGQHPPCILLLLHRHQRVAVRTLDADEHGEEIRFPHQRQQRVIVREVNRGLGREAERIAPRLLPSDQVRQESLHSLFVADEVVVDKIDPAAMPKLIKPVEFGQHLFPGLDPRLAPVEFDDVAELAVEGAATRELHADMDVIGALQQVETRGSGCA